MTLDELYPYWQDVHDELIDVLEFSDETRWREKPAHQAGLNIRQIVLRLIQTEQEWIGHVAQGFPRYPFSPSDFPDKAALLDGLRAAREFDGVLCPHIAASGPARRANNSARSGNQYAGGQPADLVDSLAGRPERDLLLRADRPETARLTYYA